MSEHGLEWILRDLGGERIRRGEGAARKGVVEDAMEIDDRLALAHGPVQVYNPPYTSDDNKSLISNIISFLEDTITEAQRLKMKLLLWETLTHRLLSKLHYLLVQLQHQEL